MNDRTARWVRFACLLMVVGVAARAYGQAPGGGGGHPPMGQAPGRPPGMPGGPGGTPPGGGASNAMGGNAGANVGGTTRSASVTAGGVKLGPTGRWWDERSMIQTMGINRDQQRRMDAIFNANKSSIVESYKVLQTQNAKVDALSKDSNVDKNQLFAAIDAANQARAELQKATTQMLLEIRGQLSKEQVTRLESLP
jgi:outer membrane murein-binding lipoprotein Lpp